MKYDPDHAPLVSIAMTTFNAGNHLSAQLDSVLRQNYPNLEIVIADDGSNDGTYEKLQELSCVHERIRLLPQTDRTGVNANFMRCMRACRGEWISPCDQDDIWLPEKTGILMAQVPEGGLAFCDSRFIDPSGNELDWFGHKTIADAFGARFRLGLLDILFRNCVSGHAMLFSRDLLVGLPPVLDNHFYDWWITIWAKANKRPVEFVDKALVLYRRHPGSVTVAEHQRSDRWNMAVAWRLRYMSARRIARHLSEGAEKNLLIEYADVLHHWFTHWFSLRAVRYFYARRDVVFRKEKPASKRRKARRHLIGYKLKSSFQPWRYSRLTFIDADRVEFACLAEDPE